MSLPSICPRNTIIILDTGKKLAMAVMWESRMDGCLGLVLSNRIKYHSTVFLSWNIVLRREGFGRFPFCSSTACCGPSSLEFIFSRCLFVKIPLDYQPSNFH